MRSANYFRVGSRVIANSLFGPKILGIYKGSRGSFGVIIYGRPLGSEETEVDHVCSKLSMELYKLPKPPGSLTKDKLKIKAGDQVTGSNYMGLIIKGSYMNRDGKYAWIKGWSEKDSRLEHPKVYRILSSTLLKL